MVSFAPDGWGLLLYWWPHDPSEESSLGRIDEDVHSIGGHNAGDFGLDQPGAKFPCIRVWEGVPKPIESDEFEGYDYKPEGWRDLNTAEWDALRLGKHPWP